MKFIHLADLHIGKRVCEFPMIEDQRHVLAESLDIARHVGAACVLVSGDLYDKATPGAEAVALVDWFLEACATAGLQVVAVAGNHDSAERVAYARGLLARQGVHLSPVFDGNVARCVLNDEHGPVTFWMMPFVRPAAVRPFFPEERIESHTDAVQAVLDRVRRDEAFDPKGRNVLLAHQFVTWSGGQTERCDSELQLGTLDNVDARVFEGFSYVALGHVHRPQRVMLDTIRYAGSPLKYSASESRDKKSVPVVDIDGFGNVTVSLEPLHPLHDMRVVKGRLQDLLGEEALGADGRDDYVHAVLTDEQPPLGYREMLRDAYPNLMSIVLEGTRREAGRVTAAPTRIKTPAEAFAEFFEAMNATPLDDAQRALVEKTLSRVEAMQA